jgi:hypothetical protein
MYCLFCVVLCIVCVYMCTVLLPPSGYPIAVNKYIISYIILNTISYHVIYHITYHIISHIILYHISHILYHIKTRSALLTDCFRKAHLTVQRCNVQECSCQRRSEWKRSVKRFNLGLILELQYSISLLRITPWHTMVGMFTNSKK